MRLKNILKLVIAIIVCELAGIIGSLFTMPAIPTWYAGLAKPVINPPAWIFGPVWTALYFLMGVALWVVWKKEDAAPKARRQAILIFFVQLALNAFWSIIFFSWRSPGGAFAEIIFLWLAILATLVAFAKISKSAECLLIPYIVWVSFAGYLNFAIWQLSRF